MTGIRLLSVAVVAVLSGCGGGGGGGDDACARESQLLPGALSFSRDTPQQTPQSTLTAGGDGFVPANSSCELVTHLSNPNDPFSAPTGWSCQCSTTAPVCVTWKNETSGAGGRGNYQVRSGAVEISGVPIAVCAPAYTRWTADIPLVAGANRLVVTMSDQQRGGLASATVTRN